MNALTLFAGAGGADLGLRRAGFAHLACVEGDATACATLRAAGFPAVHAWIGGPGPDGQPAWQWDGTPVDLLWASPPCQPYSRAGKRLGASDARDGWPATLATIAEVRPRWVIVENVRGAPVDQWERELAALGYTTSAALLDAADWGLPSHRTRWYLVAGPRGYRWPDSTHYGPRVPWLLRGRRIPWVGFGDALGVCGRALPGNGGNLPASRDPADPAHTITAKSVMYLLSVADRGAGMIARHGDRPATPAAMPIGAVRAQGRGGHLLLSLPARAVAATEVKGTNYRATGGPQGPMRASDSLHLATGRRRLTWQECATLVGFPADYPFQGTSEALYRQIGNAVAPVMAEVLGRQISA